MWDQDQPSDGGEVFRDVITLFLLGLVAIVMLMLPHLHPPGKADARTLTEDESVIVEISWSGDSDTDVDLWVEAPGDHPVGYSSQNSPVFNLLRDDLGNRSDITDHNHEVAYSRGINPGEYTVNLHLFRIDPRNPPPVAVAVQVFVKRTSGGKATKLLESIVELDALGRELTVFRFVLDETGRLDPESVHTLQKFLRNRR